MRRRNSLNLRWSRVITAASLCLTGVALAGFGMGLWVGDDSDQVAALTQEVSSLRDRLAEAEEQPLSMVPTVFVDSNTPITFSYPDTGLERAAEPSKPKTFLGVAGTTVASKGIKISSVIEDTAAKRAGLMEGDLVTEFDGEAVLTFQDLKNAITSRPVGETVDITVERDGSQLHIKATLGSR